MADKFNVTPRLLEMAGYEWKIVSRRGEPIEELEGRQLGAVRRALAARGIEITGMDGSTTGMRSRTTTTTGTSGAAGSRPRAAGRTMSAGAGNGKTSRAKSTSTRTRTRTRAPIG